MKIPVSYFTHVLICIVLLIVSCSPRVTERSAWESVPVIADGIPQEWEMPLSFYDDKSMLQYNITNDSSNLYICIRATQKQTQRKMLLAGMQVFIDSSGKNTETTCVLFPAPLMTVKPNLKKDEKVEYAPDEQPGRHESLLNLPKSYLLTGFHAAVNGMRTNDNSFGLRLALLRDKEDILTYEAVIPVSTFYHSSFTASDTARKFGFEIVLHAMAAPQIKSGGNTDSGGRGGMRGGGGGMRRAGGGGMGGGGGSMRGGGTHNGRGAASHVDQEYMTKENKIRMRFSPSLK